MKNKTTFGLSLEKIGRLLRLGVEDGRPRRGTPSSGAPREMLREFLSRELPLDPATPHSLPAVLKRPCDDLPSAAGRTIYNLLLDPGTDIAVITALKDYGKALPQCHSSDAWRAVATAIYYAAIASALLHHGRRITRLSYEKLREGYEKLEEKPWIPSDLKDLFKKAKAACQESKG